eukprot:RCo030115
MYSPTCNGSADKPERQWSPPTAAEAVVMAPLRRLCLASSCASAESSAASTAGGGLASLTAVGNVLGLVERQEWERLTQLSTLAFAVSRLGESSYPMLGLAAHLLARGKHSHELPKRKPMESVSSAPPTHPRREAPPPRAPHGEEPLLAKLQLTSGSLRLHRRPLLPPDR